MIIKICWALIRPQISHSVINMLQFSLLQSDFSSTATSTGDRSGFATSRLVTENAKSRLGQPKTGSSVKITRTISSSGGKSGECVSYQHAS